MLLYGRKQQCTFVFTVIITSFLCTWLKKCKTRFEDHSWITISKCLAQKQGWIFLKREQLVRLDCLGTKDRETVLRVDDWAVDTTGNTV